MRKYRVIVLMHESLIPPESLEGFTEEEILEWKTEFDVVTTLREMGHEVQPLGVSDNLRLIREAITNFHPHIAFNLLEEFHGVGVYDHHVVSYLELMKQSYTGCNPRGLLLAHDKPLAKKLLAYHRIRTPKFAVIPCKKKVRVPQSLKFPLLVKSAFEDASLGISEASIVRDEEQLNEQVQYLHQELETDALVETYIDGRELYVGVLGNRRLVTLPIWEMEFRKADADIPRIATREVKWDEDHQKKLGIVTAEAQNLTPEAIARIQSVCKRVYRVLGLSGFARIDLRMNDRGDIHVLEANPNPNLSFGEDFAESAERAGIAYEDLLTKIINLGLNYQAEWRLVQST